MIQMSIKLSKIFILNLSFRVSKIIIIWMFQLFLNLEYLSFYINFSDFLNHNFWYLKIRIKNRTFWREKNVKNVRFLALLLGYKNLEIFKSEIFIGIYMYQSFRNHWQNWKIQILNALKLRLKLGIFKWRKYKKDPFLISLYGIKNCINLT